MGKIDEARLIAMKHQSDPTADALAMHYQDGAANGMFKAAIAARYASPDMVDPRVAEFLNDRRALPDWAVPARLQQGAEFFAEWGVPLGLGLFLQALPLAYASVEGVQVLALTSKLETEANRRVLESAQFVLDVTTPGALAPGGIGYLTTRHVRLMHAGVRNLITRREDIPESTDPTLWPRWDPSWGIPINQQHMLGAMLSYSSSLLNVLDLLGAEYEESGAADYCLLWNAIGWLLGVDESILPLERHEMEDLEVTIRRLNEGESDAGKMMTAALIKLVRSYMKVPGFKGFPVTLMRLFIGDTTADLLDVPKAGWTRVFTRAARGLGRGSGRKSPALRRAVQWTSTHTLRGFVAHERGPDRPTFSIPTELNVKLARSPRKPAR